MFSQITPVNLGSNEQEGSRPKALSNPKNRLVKIEWRSFWFETWTCPYFRKTTKPAQALQDQISGRK